MSGLSFKDLYFLFGPTANYIQSLQKRHKLALTRFEKALPITKAITSMRFWSNIFSKAMQIAEETRKVILY